MFDTWQNFYLLIGPSAAALIGWLFVVATLTQNSRDHAQSAYGMRVYSTPLEVIAGAVPLIAAAGIGLVLGWPDSCRILATSFLGHLMVAIYNAWDLVTFLAPRARSTVEPATD